MYNFAFDGLNSVVVPICVQFNSIDNIMSKLLKYVPINAKCIFHLSVYQFQFH